MNELTDKQELFVQNLLLGKNCTEAYKIAFPHCAADKAANSAKRLFKQRHVKARYDELIIKLRKEAEEENIVTVKKVLDELSHIAFADINDYLSFRSVPKVVGKDPETDEPIYANISIVELIDSTEVDGKAIANVSVNEKGVISFKLYDKISALDKIAKYLGLYTTK